MTVSAAILYLAACISDVIHKIGQYDISINYVTPVSYTHLTLPTMAVV